MNLTLDIYKMKFQKFNAKYLNDIDVSVIFL